MKKRDSFGKVLYDIAFNAFELTLLVGIIVFGLQMLIN